MLEKFIPQLVNDLELGDATLASGVPGVYSIPLEEDVAVILSTLPDGFMIKCNVAAVPNNQEEKVFTRAMLGNLFNQGARGGAVIGLTPDGTKVTVSLVVDRQIDYKEFRELLEDFFNVVDVWRDEVRSFAPPPKK